MRVGLPDGVTKLATNSGHTCALIRDGDVYCWGDRLQPALNGSYATQLHPEKVAGVSKATTLVADVNSICVVRAGQLLCWGNNKFGQLGDGSRAGTPTPQLVPGIDDVTAVGVSFQTACAVTGGALYCWGSNDSNQASPTDERAYLTRPQRVDNITGKVTSVSAGLVTCFETSDNAVFCWGYNRTGQLGIGTTESSKTPSEIHF